MKSIVDALRLRAHAKNLRFCLCAGIGLAVLFSAVALPSLFSAAFAPAGNAGAGYMQHRDAAQPLPAERALAFTDDAGRVLAGFSSHLPLILIDAGGRAVPVHQELEPGRSYMQPIPGVEPFVPCDVYVYDSGEYNKLTDEPTARTKAKIKRRGNTSHSFEKAHYKLKLFAEDGAENRLPLLGMEAEDEWVLNGCMLDKSLLRNYLSFTVIAEVMPYTPDVRYCEVLVRDEHGGLRYDGVYLLMESVKQGPGRVALSEEPPRGGEHSYLLRRDRYDPERPMLRTYATEKGLSSGYLGLLYPKGAGLDEAVLHYVESYVSAAEKALYADDVHTFLTYADYIDVDSFVDYFVLNEFFGNYDAGWNSTYYYKDLGGKLCAGPVWDYDGIMDNYIPVPMDPEAVAFANAPWFDRLIRDRGFAERVLTRYAELRRGPLSSKRIDTLLHDAATYLGPARQRDWQRWHDIYTGSKYALWDVVTPITPFEQATEPARLRRQTDSYEQELLKFRYLLHAHGASIPDALPQMAFLQAGVVSAADDYKKNSMLVSAFLLAFATAAWIARRHGNA
ncbi:MAG: CotH kinase family protein [Clostridiales Family XIII bacterium]|jgi:hypothetical protein|nr:CotH kinase family protein [Clostridiales Family XIII bacterium]